MEHFDEWKKGLKSVFERAKTKDWGAVIKEGTAIRDMYPDYVEEHSVYEMLAEAYTAKGNKAAAIADWSVREDRRARSRIAEAAGQTLEEAGRKKEAADALNRLNFIYPMDPGAHRSLGALLLDAGQRRRERSASMRAVLAKNPHGSRAGALRSGPRLPWPTNRWSRRKKNCLPRWKPRPGSAPRRSSC